MTSYRVKDDKGRIFGTVESSNLGGNAFNILHLPTKCWERYYSISFPEAVKKLRRLHRSYIKELRKNSDNWL